MTGYWWNPHIRNNIYQIAYFEVDLSRVVVYRIPQPGIKGEVDEYLYPLAGKFSKKREQSFLIFFRI
jgi:hypothetical protein